MQERSMRRLLTLLVLLLMSLGSGAQPLIPAEDVFAEEPSEEAKAWLDDAVASYNGKMADLRRDWLVNVTGARTDLRRRLVIVETQSGPVAFDAKSIGGFGKRNDRWLWMWSWGSGNLPVNFRLPSAALNDVGTRLKLPFLTKPDFYSNSTDLPFLVGAVALKVYGGVGVHRVRVPYPGDPFDVYYLLSNPRRGTD